MCCAEALCVLLCCDAKVLITMWFGQIFLQIFFCDNRLYDFSTIDFATIDIATIDRNVSLFSAHERFGYPHSALSDSRNALCGQPKRGLNTAPRPRASWPVILKKFTQRATTTNHNRAINGTFGRVDQKLW